jgi:hypothetical protein
MQRGTVLSVVGVGCVIVVSGLIYYWVQSGSSFVCTPPPKTDIEKYEKIIAALDQVIDLGIKLSTTLAGLGAALLLGLKSGLKASSLVNLLVFLATVLFVESALYAIWWRTGIAELWLNDCLPLVAENRLEYRFNAHFYLFVAGLISLGLIVVGAVFTKPDSQSGGGTT